MDWTQAEVISYVMWSVPLAAGWLLDRLIGDPQWLPHLVVGFGKVISLFERRFNRGVRRKLKGGATAVLLIAAVFAAVWVLLKILTPYPWVKVIVEIVGVFYCLAGTTLSREVRMVFEACDRSLEAGRRQVGRIVGRDTAALSDGEVRTAALETLAENLSDGVIAPLFWYLLLGLPGMMAYKMVNTLDSMIGYKTSRYMDFGCVAAKVDDVANYIPARLTALLMTIAAGRPGLMRFVARYGRCHASPNSGYPEAALAGILDCRFGGTHDYFGETVYKPYIGETQRALTWADFVCSRRVCLLAEIMMLLVSLLLRPAFS